MGWLFLEVLVALAIAAGLIWWTLPRKHKGKADAGKPADPDGPPRD